ncbi:MAG: hypothetical protein A2928_02690 [Candidatus Taylorbacteria bacterium RIFCSPLOWO2_01_FULL_45_15b]|uniref:Bacterial type II secretion system protein E domain-containing protein n=1 Tax=Candidatus Taylorbacteria bacterium RIFCSPLOWO2_01_FULL_45_15b TaxID=1802319 RepID=A0A1G2N7K3_9BACT|nr:MAG: hypothetical protein A2928_02690 [Candidatus Taylorbacteria bacterium RIFCSPLOWO2_01_FULL_45_15b]
MSLVDLLAEKKIIELDSVQTIKDEIAQTGGDFEALLTTKYGVNPYDFLGVKGEYYGIPTKSLDGVTVPFEILKYIPEDSASHYNFVPIGMEDGVLEIGVVDPDNIEARDALNFISAKINLPYKVYLLARIDFDKVIQTYKGLSGEVTQALSELETDLSADKVIEAELGEVKKDFNMDDPIGDTTPATSRTRIIEDAPVTKIVATMLNYATQGNASDIHVEHMGENVRVRFRVDGFLNTSLILPSKIHSAVVARIKILSNMRLDEKRKPQDGRFSAKIEGRKVDFRVSTFPAYYGEKIVMRILDSERGVKPIDQMGLSARNLKLIKEAIGKPYGMILITGPTGSGKSTTLYSMLNELDKERLNVLSLEDPVEYNIPGMSQSQVRPEIGYTFANGLRSTLRQDPDIIMVGEIRDKETAQLAVQAALTGHLVLSTIHTNNAAGVIPRLLDMGVDRYLIAPTLILAIAQRLVMTLCPGTGKPVPVEDSVRKIIDKEFESLPEKYKSEIPKLETVYEIEPSATCPKGTIGRAAVFEVLQMSKELERAVLEDASELSVSKIAREQGMLSMKEDAIIKAVNREIPFEEVNKL